MSQPWRVLPPMGNVLENSFYLGIAENGRRHLLHLPTVNEALAG